MSHGYVAPGYVKPGYVKNTGASTPAAPTVSGHNVRFRSSTIESQVFLTTGPAPREVEYEFSNGRQFKESP